MAPPSGADSSTLRRDALLALAVFVVALAPRLAFPHFYPARPFTDFQAQVAFAQAFNAHAFAPGYAGWAMFGPGLALALAPLLRLVPAAPDDVARTATAVVTALSALIPFILWRGVLGLPARLSASLGLALWPSHVLFAGVVAQDNWVLPPAVALAALAVRALARADGGAPILSGLLLAAAAAIRPEMLVALLPLLPAAAGLLRPPRAWPWARLAAAAAALLLALAVLGGLRWAGTGRFGLTPDHAGYGGLGSMVPGAGTSWTPPGPYVASIAPQLAAGEAVLYRESWPLMWRELARGPRFHALRMLTAAAMTLFRTDVDSLYWSIGFGGAVPEAARPRVVAFVHRLEGPLVDSTLVLLALTAAALLLALRYRHSASLLIGAAMALKVAVHGLLAVQTRYYVVVMAFAILLVAIALGEARRRAVRAQVLALGAGIAIVLLSRALVRKAEARVLAAEEQVTYRFTLRGPERIAQLDCSVREGIVSLLWAQQARAAFHLLHVEPAAAERASADCVATATRTTAVELRLGDGYLEGGFPDRLVQTVEVDGVPRLERQVAAEPGGAWAAVPLGVLEPGQRRGVVVRLTARRQDPGFRWGSVNTEIAITAVP